MPSYRAVVIRPTGYLHSRCFDDVAGAFNGALVDLGVFHPEGREIVFGGHLLPRFGGIIGADSILFNTEVPGSGWFNADYLDLLSKHEVWDYDVANVAYLIERGINAKHCPIRYHKSLTRLDIGSYKFEADVLFYGSVNERRLGIWHAIGEREPELCMRWLTHDHWDSRDFWIERSKIVLNMHFYDNAPLEIVRVSFLLANSAFVISEGPVWEDMRDGMVFAEPGFFPNLVGEWLDNEAGRRRMRNRGFEIFSQMTQASVLKGLLS